MRPIALQVRGHPFNVLVECPSSTIDDVLRVGYVLLLCPEIRVSISLTEFVASWNALM